MVLTSALYAHALTHPGCVETGITPADVGIEDAQEIAYLSHDISPISVISRISPRPLLLIYGELEAQAARPQEQLAQAGEPKEIWIVPGCWHGGYLDVAPEEWERRVVMFLDEALLFEE
jgi:hypothetical protein